MKTLRIAETDFEAVRLSEKALDSVALVHAEAVALLLDGQIKNVVGVGRAHKWVNGRALPEACIQVQVVEKVSMGSLPVDHRIPSLIGGVKTDVVEVGEIEFEELTEKVRPLQTGFSVGAKHNGIQSTGTLGAFVVGRIDEQQHYYVLSNNHVLAHYNAFPIGTEVTQPGPDDGGDDEDVCGVLGSFVSLSTTGNNKVDAALATVSIDDIPEVRPYVNQTVPSIVIGMNVIKNGRTTELTAGSVVADSVTVNKSDPAGNVYSMVEQVTASYLSGGGDSGSLVLSRADNKAVGLHWGASTQGARYLCTMDNVLTELGVSLY